MLADVMVRRDLKESLVPDFFATQYALCFIKTFKRAVVRVIDHYFSVSYVQNDRLFILTTIRGVSFGRVNCYRSGLISSQLEI